MIELAQRANNRPLCLLMSSFFCEIFSTDDAESVEICVGRYAVVTGCRCRKQVEIADTTTMLWLSS
jgi:hypothetical protein